MNSENKKSRAMTVVYPVGTGLYVNVTNRCTNRCDFCIRNNGEGAYGSDSLWLEREPSVDEIKAAILGALPGEYTEVVFCGYGEPSIRLPEIRDAALAVKAAYPDIPVRINTNGQSDLILGCDSTALYKDAFDAVSISLNAPSAEGYDKICHSIYGIGALDAIKLFAKNVKNQVKSVAFSVVEGFISDTEIAECRKIAEECGVNLRVREYISE